MVLFLRELQESIKLDKIDKILIALVFIIGAVLSPVFASEGEVVETTALQNVSASSNSNAFLNSGNLRYFEVEKGYIYTITCLSDLSTGRVIVGSSSVPSVGVNYEILYENLKYTGDTYTYYANNNNIVFISFSPNVSATSISVTREKMQSMDGAIGDLVNNVGPSAIWDVFNTSINYIYIVVIVAFGIFIISLAIKKISKGKGRI